MTIFDYYSFNHAAALYIFYQLKYMYFLLQFM